MESNTTDITRYSFWWKLQSWIIRCGGILGLGNLSRRMWKQLLQVDEYTHETRHMCVILVRGLINVQVCYWSHETMGKQLSLVSQFFNGATLTKTWAAWWVSSGNIWILAYLVSWIINGVEYLEFGEVSHGFAIYLLHVGGLMSLAMLFYWWMKYSKPRYQVFVPWVLASVWWVSSSSVWPCKAKSIDWW